MKIVFSSPTSVETVHGYTDNEQTESCTLTILMFHGDYEDEIITYELKM